MRLKYVNVLVYLGSSRYVFLSVKADQATQNKVASSNQLFVLSLNLNELLSIQSYLFIHLNRVTFSVVLSLMVIFSFCLFSCVVAR